MLAMRNEYARGDTVITQTCYFNNQRTPEDKLPVNGCLYLVIALFHFMYILVLTVAMFSAIYTVLW